MKETKKKPVVPNIFMIYIGMYHKYFYKETNFGVTVGLAGIFD